MMERETGEGDNRADEEAGQGHIPWPGTGTIVMRTLMRTAMVIVGAMSEVVCVHVLKCLVLYSCRAGTV